MLLGRLWRAASQRTPSGVSGGVTSRSLLGSDDSQPEFSSASAAPSRARGAKRGAKSAAADSHRSTGEGFDAADPWGVLPTLARLESLLGPKAMPPTSRVAIIGNQSAGKSSLLEALVGIEFLPKGTGIVTRRPLELSLIRSQSGSWAEFEDGRRVYDWAEVQDRISEGNADVELDEEPLRMSIFAPHVHNLNLVDLPGYISAVRSGQSKDLPQRIADMCSKYIKPKDNIVLAVVSAAEDAATSIAVQQAQMVDQDFDRSLGVLTKMDMRKDLSDVKTTLRNKAFPLGLGYAGVRCRTQKELNDGMQLEELDEVEEAWMESSGLRERQDLRLGMPTLRKMLTTELLKRAAVKFPDLVQGLDEVIAKAREDEQFLLAISKESDLKNVARELEKLVLQFHPTAGPRMEFEARLRERVGHVVRARWDHAISRNFALPMREKPQALQGLPTHMAPHHQDNIALRKQSYKVLNQLDALKYAPKAAGVLNEDLNDALIFGEGLPTYVDDGFLARSHRENQAVGALSPWFQLMLPADHEVGVRSRWANNLTNTVHDVLDEDHLADGVTAAALDELLQFVDMASEATRGARREGELARVYFRYLLKSLAGRLNEDGFEAGLRSCVGREQRASVDTQSLMAAIEGRLSAEGIRPKLDTLLFNPVDRTDGWPLMVPLYSTTFTKAYFDVVSARTSDDVFRMLAVSLVNPIIFESIHHSLNMFKSGRLFREAGRQLKYIKDLQGLRQSLEDASKGLAELNQ